MEAELYDNKIIIKWNFTGNSGAEIITVFRTKAQAENSGKLMPDSVIGTENIRSGIFTYPLADEGKYYYGIYIRDENRVIEFKPGVNISTGSLGTGNGKKDTVIEEKIPEKDKTEEREITEHKDIPPDDAVIKDKKDTREDIIKEPDREKSDEHKYAADYDLDYIINNYFYRERYYEAVKELNIFISKTDNKREKARARLFLARSYIETEQYGKSVKLLNMDDVKSFFPEESKFWSDFAMARIR
jgi:hypothetical protein